MQGTAHVTLIGTITKTPFERDDNTPIIRATVAQRNEAGPSYSRIAIIGGYAKTLMGRLTAGTPVALQGSLRQSSWNDREGNQQTTFETVVQNLAILGEDVMTITDKAGSVVMMSGLNEVTIQGNISSNVKAGQASNDDSYTNFTVAVNERYYNRDHQARERTSFIRINGLNLGLALGKGQAVSIRGFVTDTSYEKGGKQVYTTVVRSQDAYALASRTSQPPTISTEELSAPGVGDVF